MLVKSRKQPEVAIRTAERLRGRKQLHMASRRRPLTLHWLQLSCMQLKRSVQLQLLTRRDADEVDKQP